MPVVQHASKEIRLKIVYYGPGLGGKTTNLEYLHAHSRPELRGKLLSLNTEAERTVFFDLLPVDLGTYHGYRIRLHLCTVPGQIALDSTRRLVLRNVDGVVFVVDTQKEALHANIESMANLERNLVLQGDDPRRLPLVVQYNKRDLPGVMSVQELQWALHVPAEVPQFEACARMGQGVADTLKAVVKMCLRIVGDPQQAPEGRSASIMPGMRASMFPGGRPPVLQMPSIPPPPRLPSSARHVPPTRREWHQQLAQAPVPTSKQRSA